MSLTWKTGYNSKHVITKSNDEKLPGQYSTEISPSAGGKADENKWHWDICMIRKRYANNGKDRISITNNNKNKPGSS